MAKPPRPVALGIDKGYDSGDFVMELREQRVTPHLAQNQNGRRSAIEGRTTRHPGYAISLRIRKRIKETSAAQKRWLGCARYAVAGVARSTGNSPSPQLPSEPISGWWRRRSGAAAPTARSGRGRHCLGMLLLQGGSTHSWIGILDHDLDLVATLNDATGAIYSAMLVEEQGMMSSFQGLAESITAHGLFRALYADRGCTIFIRRRPQARSTRSG